MYVLKESASNLPADKAARRFGTSDLLSKAQQQDVVRITVPSVEISEWVAFRVDLVPYVIKALQNIEAIGKELENYC